MTQQQVVNRNCNRVFEVLTQGMPDDSKMAILSGSFIAGGSLLHSEEAPNDYDVFFKTEAAARLVVGSAGVALRSWSGQVARAVSTQDEANPRLSSLKITLDDPLENAIARGRNMTARLHHHSALTRRVSMVTSNSVSLTSRIQLITRFIGPVADVLDTFDFEHCKVVWEPSLVSPTGGTLTYHGESAKAIAEKTLLYQPHSRFVFSAMKRIEKFVKRGYSIPVSTIINLKRSFDTLDLSDPDVIEQELSNYYGINEELAARIRNFCLNAEGRVDIEALETIAKEL